MIIKMIKTLLISLFLLNTQLIIGNEPSATNPEIEAFQDGSQGNIARYYQLIEELDQPTASPVMDQYILGILKNNHHNSFIEKYFGKSKYSAMMFANFCVKQRYIKSVKEILEHMVLLDWEDESWDNVGINDKGEWVFPYWTPFWFLITAFEEDLEDVVDLLWPKVQSRYKVVYAAEYGDLKHFSETYEMYDWDEEISKSVLKECLSNAFASRTHELVDYLLEKEPFEPIEIVTAAANGGGWADYRRAIELIDLSTIDLQFLLKQAIIGCDYRIVRDVLNRGAKLVDKEDIRSLLRTGIPELVHIGLSNIDNIDDQLFLGLSNAYGPFSGGIGSWDPKLDGGGNVFFIGVTEDILEDQRVMKLLSGMINPGSNDTFPRSDEPFNWEDVLVSPMRKFSDLGTEEVKDMEGFYQTMIAYAKEHNLPYLGLCGGSQHLVLHHGGYIRRVEGHLGTELQVSLIPGTVSHYLAMTPDEKTAFMQSGTLPSLIIERVSVAHNYAAVEGMLGYGINLGGVSEFNVPETFNKGLWMVGCQFHPESLYDDVDFTSVNRNKQILDSYLQMCLLRKELRKEFPEEDKLIDEMNRIERETLECLQNSNNRDIGIAA